MFIYFAWAYGLTRYEAWSRFIAIQKHLEATKNTFGSSLGSGDDGDDSLVNHEVIYDPIETIQCPTHDDDSAWWIIVFQGSSFRRAGMDRKFLLLVLVFFWKS